MSEDKSLAVLKFVVKFMGIILVLGTIVLIVMVVLKANGLILQKKNKDTQSAEYSEGATSGGVCKKLTASHLEVDVEGDIQQMSVEGQLLYVRTQAQGRQFIYVIERCSGAVKQVIKLT